MMGMVYKDFMVQRKTMLYYLFFMVFYSFLSITGVLTLSAILGMGSMIGLLLSLNSFSFDDEVKWDTFAAVTSNGRRNIVLGKYVFTLLTTLGATLLVLITSVICSVIGLMEDTILDLVIVITVCFIFSSSLGSIVIPLIFKFGPQKVRIIMVSLAAVIFGGTALLEVLMKNGLSLPEIPEMPESVILFLPIIGLLICLILLVASYLISIRIYQNKDF